MPTTGTISHRLLPAKLPGYEAARGCIEITFTMQGVSSSININISSTC